MVGTLPFAGMPLSSLGTGRYGRFRLAPRMRTCRCQGRAPGCASSRQLARRRTAVQTCTSGASSAQRLRRPGACAAHPPVVQAAGAPVLWTVSDAARECGRSRRGYRWRDGGAEVGLAAACGGKLAGVVSTPAGDRSQAQLSGSLRCCRAARSARRFPVGRRRSPGLGRPSPRRCG